MSSVSDAASLGVGEDQLLAEARLVVRETDRDATAEGMPEQGDRRVYVERTENSAT